MHKKSDIGCVIVNWNNKADIIACLSSLQKYAPHLSVVVADNDSTDGSPMLIRKRFPDVTVLPTGGNLGYAAGNNIGIRRLLTTDVRYIAILNPDTVIESDIFPYLRDTLLDNPSIGIVGPEIVGRNGKIWSRGGVIDGKRYTAGLIGLGDSPARKPHQSKPVPVDYVPGAAMFMRREVVERIGVFYEPYFIYYEDVEMCIRARKAGFGLAYVPGVRIFHNESSSFGRESPTQSYYLARNHLLFVLRNAPFTVTLREMVRLPKTIMEHKKRNQPAALVGIQDFFTGKFGRKDVTHG